MAKKKKYKYRYPKRKSSWLIFKNKNRRDENDPEYTGYLRDENKVLYTLGAYVMHGAKTKFLSGKVTKMKDKYQDYFDETEVVDGFDINSI